MVGILAFTVTNLKRWEVKQMQVLHFPSGCCKYSLCRIVKMC